MTAGRDWTADAGAFTYHGGALEVARRLAPGAPEPWIDLSTGINPHPIPCPISSPKPGRVCPRAAALAELEAAAAPVTARPPEAWSRAPARRRSSRRWPDIIAARRRRRAGADLRRPRSGLRRRGRARSSKRSGSRTWARFDVAIVVNPNNPDGRITPRADLLELHGRLAPRGGVLIVDEAFADFDGESESLAPVLPEGRGRAALVRQVVRPRRLASRLRDRCRLTSSSRLRAALGPWPVSGPAIAIGTRRSPTSPGRTRCAIVLARRPARLDGLLKTPWLAHPRRDAAVPPRSESRRARRV